MKIAGYLKTSLIEWPTKIASVIFVPGCNFACPFCHNRDLVKINSKKLKHHSEKIVLTDLKRRSKWIDGVAVTGGEPTLQPDLLGFSTKVKALGFKIMIETNGSRPEVIKKLLEAKLVDFWAMDYKTTFSDYENVVGIKSGGQSDPGSKSADDPGSLAAGIKESMRLIIDSGLPFEFRTTIVPTIHDEKVLLTMARDLKNLFAGCGRKIRDFSWVLQSFQPKNCLDPGFNEIEPFAVSQLKAFKKMISEMIPKTKLRGVGGDFI
ncbi:MAG: anaerobic ribonucleoside-triphosphate reductase activating protein [Candidatus Pacebacteria bacterium]|nr:anaerobic ribonucleoside-triphosphate reductase activating protein [Candidatus Paceibacterota bacterium]